MKKHSHTLAILVMNNPGVMARIAGLYSRRGYNISSLAVGETEDPRISRITLVVEAEDENELEQITKQLYKLIDVIKLSDITKDDAVERELALIKVHCNSTNRSEILQIVDIFRAKIVDVSQEGVIIEATGDSDKIQAILDLLRPFGIREIARTGKVALVRSAAGR
ncbi:MAG: acetolactate synthase small subunit [Firmicutes bacterium]|jgi:acetolactate synthase-1/3 small subunit|nr:acetolactate synthase small subunit [Bacillota bacterium]